MPANFSSVIAQGEIAWPSKGSIEMLEPFTDAISHILLL